MKKLGRNDACWCGSQKKYKHCHEAFDEKLEEAARAGHFIPSHDMIKTPEQLEGIRESCKINIAVLDYVAEHIQRRLTSGFTMRPQREAESRLLWDTRAFPKASAPPLTIRCATGFLQRMWY